MSTSKEVNVLLNMLRVEVKDLHDYIDQDDAEALKSCKNATTILQKLFICLKKEMVEDEA